MNLTAGKPVDPVILSMISGGNTVVTATFTSPEPVPDPNPTKEDNAINSSTQGMGVNNNWVDGPNESIYVSFDKDLTDIGFTVGNLTSSDGLRWEVWKDGVKLDSGTYVTSNTSESKDVTFVLSQNGLDPGTVFDEVRLSAAESTDEYRLLTMSAQVQLAPSTLTMNFGLAATDMDGDVANGNLSVSVAGGPGPGYTLTGSADGDILQGSTGNDILTGGAGSDILIGGGGHDTFDFNADSFTNPANDRITDFKIGTDSNADVLNISDLLTGAHASNSAIPDNISSAISGGFLRVETVDATTARIVLDIDGNGAGTSSVPIVTLENLTSGFNENTLLTTLLDNDQLK